MKQKSRRWLGWLAGWLVGYGQRSNQPTNQSTSQHVPKRPLGQVLCIGLLGLFFLSGTAVMAQDGAPDEPPQLFVTDHSVDSPPQVALTAFGRDGMGAPLDLSQEMILLRHGGTAVADAGVAGQPTIGTFTVFLIDNPTGVADQLPAIQEAISQFASSPTMQEQTDAIAIYQVGASEATQLLAPDKFYNSVRNLFATPLASETQATALVDSMGNLLEQVESLKPEPEMAASLVVISDGTDVVSSQFALDDVPERAAVLGIPVHTIWLDNQDLTAGGKAVGQEYLAAVAAGSRGRTAQLSDGAAVTAIWNLIASFRDQYRITYTMPELTSGDFTVQVALADEPEAVVETSITVPDNLPSLTLDVPSDSRTLTWPDLAEPVKLRLQPTVTWLDGVERTIEVAQVVVNDVPVQDIPVAELTDFEASINNFVYGENQLQIAALDEQGIRVTSPPLLLTVVAGDADIPAALAPSPGLGRLLRNGFLLLLAVALLGGGLVYAQREGWLARLPLRLPRGGRSRRGRVQITEPDGSPAGTAVPAPGHDAGLVDEADDLPPALAYLEVLESITRVPVEYALTGAQVRLGRSPGQSDICFENDITVSRLHASLMLEGTHYRIYDEKSTSGTWVNDQQVPDYGIQLTDGDEIHLGAVHLRFHQPQARQATG